LSYIYRNHCTQAAKYIAMLRVTNVCRIAYKQTSASLSLRNGRIVYARGFAKRGNSGTRGAGSWDKELSAKLMSEYKLEGNLNQDIRMPEDLKDYIKSGIFKVDAEPGESEVRLSRRFGSETIEVLFSMPDPEDRDHQTGEEIPMEEEEMEETEEETEESNGPEESVTSTPMSSKDMDVMEAEQENEDIDSEVSGESFPVDCKIIIKKPGVGALEFHAITEGAVFVIFHVNYIRLTELAAPQTAEADWQRTKIYKGIEFAFLDEVSLFSIHCLTIGFARNLRALP